MQPKNKKKSYTFNQNIENMKNKIYFLPALLLIMLGAIQYGCKEEADEICQSFDAECNSPELATTCCTDDQCYYEYNGERYENDAAGMEQLIAAMCGTDEEQATASTQSIQLRLEKQTQKLMAEVRASMICR